MKTYNIRDGRLRAILNCLAVLNFIAIPILLWLFFQLRAARTELRNATIANTLHALNGTAYAARHSDPPESRPEKAKRYVASIIAINSIFGMKDEKAAIVIRDVRLKFPEIDSWLESRDKAYLAEMDALWAKKTLGFPDW